ncbi:MAG: GldG family protein [Lachnospiraceae bacterium]|nr:GldG family protein [Lachnospiraceae bacterium]
MKKFGKGIQRISMIALIFVFLIMVNVLAGKIVSKFNLKLDLTLSHLYSISHETKELMGSLDKEVTIYVICQNRDAITEFAEMFDRFDACSELLRVEYINPDTDLIFIDRYEELGIKISLNTVIIECEDNRRVLALSDMYQFSTDGALAMFNGEAMVTSAVMNVIDDRTDTVVALMGHGEDVPSVLESQLVSYGYQVAGFVLNKEVPDEVGCMLILGPQSDLSEAEILHLENYLARGGSVLYFKNAGVRELSNLDTVLDEWGIRFDYKAVMDSSYNIGSNPMYVVANFIEHDINEYFESHNYYVVTPVVNPIRQDFGNGTGSQVSVILGSSDYAYARAIDGETEDNSLAKQASDEEGPFVLAAASERSFTKEDGTTCTGKIFAIGTNRFYSDNLLEASSTGNSAYMKEVISWAIGNQDATYSIAGKQVGAQSLTVTSRQIKIFSILLIGFVPIVIIGSGVIVVVKRRYL